MPNFQFIDDFKAVVWKEGNVVYCVPTKDLSECDKRYVYEQMAAQGY